METVVQPPADAELQLLTQWGDPFERTRSRKAAALSVGAHIALIAILALMPPVLVPKPEEEPERHVTPIFLPLTPLTQKAPNKGKVTKEFNAAELEPRPRLPKPPGAPASAPPAAPLPPAPPPKQQAAAPPPVLPEAPKVEAPKQPQITAPPIVTPPPQPQIQAQETKPKSPFQEPTTPPPIVPTGRSPFGHDPVEDAIRSATHTPGGNLSLGDNGIFGPGGVGQSPLPGQIGAPGSQIELLTNDQGVDFRPYLARVLNEVRRHWLAILPDSVKLLGRRGTVAIQFAINRQGMVPKLVIVPGRSSGVDSLDRAAVAGISAAQPFPQLPSDFKGDQIVLQFNFAYNMPKK